MTKRSMLHISRRKKAIAQQPLSEPWLNLIEAIATQAVEDVLSANKPAEAAEDAKDTPPLPPPVDNTKT